MLTLVFLGPPGAGKGVVTQGISKKFNLTQVSTGDLVRAEIASGSDFGKKLAEIINKGNLVPDALISKMFETKLAEVSRDKKTKGLMIDGYPRTIEQANLLEGILSRLNQKLSGVIYIEVTKEKVVERLASRLTCEKCKRVYNTVTFPPKKQGVCDDDGAKLIGREDDNPKTVATRFDVFMEKTMPLVEFYEKKNLLIRYDGNVPVDASVAKATEIVSGLMEKQKN